jgi:hypothetical protein
MPADDVTPDLFASRPGHRQRRDDGGQNQTEFARALTFQEWCAVSGWNPETRRYDVTSRTYGREATR